MKRIPLLLAVFLVMPLAARADEASHKAKAEEMITVLHLDRMVTSVLQNAMRQTTAITEQHYGGTMPPAATAALADFQKKLSGTLAPELGWDAIKPQYVKLIEDNFPEDQIDAILAFYKSPAGQALDQKLPGVEQQIGKELQTRVQQLQPQVRQMFEDFQRNLPPATSPATPPSSGATPPATTPPTSSTTPKSTPK